MFKGITHIHMNTETMRMYITKFRKAVITGEGRNRQGSWGAGVTQDSSLVTSVLISYVNIRDMAIHYIILYNFCMSETFRNKNNRSEIKII